MGNSRNQSRTRKRKFTTNRFTKSKTEKCNVNNADITIPTVSESKLKVDSSAADVSETEEQNVIFNLEILNSVFSSLCCPVCFKSGVSLVQDSVFGLAVNMSLKCPNCKYTNAFCTSSKINKLYCINVAFVFGLRIIGKGYSAAKKLCSAMNLNTLSKTAFRYAEKKLECATSNAACKIMDEAACEVRNKIKEDEIHQCDTIIDCGVSVDGTWQRRGYSSLNGCVSAISIDTGKVLDIEIMAKMCRLCNPKLNSQNQISSHNCVKHTGSSGSMEPVGVYRIFERSSQMKKLRYTCFYGDGDSKGYDAVKNIYGEESVTKYECIGHIQKRVGSRLRKLKVKQKGLGGRGKLTDSFIDKLQNYYGIAVRSNVNDLQGMQRAVIAAFFHCCSTAKQPMHGQCPVGSNSWCKFQAAASKGITYNDKSKGLPQSVMNTVKPVYMKLCDQKLLEKCLHGKTQNANESFNCILWKFIPKDVFVELQTLRLGANMAVMQFNRGFTALLNILNDIGINPGMHTLKGFAELDSERIRESRRHSLPCVKIARKKNRMIKKRKIDTTEQEEGISYKCGEF